MTEIDKTPLFKYPFEGETSDAFNIISAGSVINKEI